MQSRRPESQGSSGSESILGKDAGQAEQRLKLGSVKGKSVLLPAFLCPFLPLLPSVPFGCTKVQKVIKSRHLESSSGGLYSQVSKARSIEGPVVGGGVGAE